MSGVGSAGVRARWLLSRLCLLCSLGCGGAGSHGSTPPVSARTPADAVVVLGHRPPLDRSGRLETELRLRVEAGITLHRAGRARWLLFAGGGKADGPVEADVMAEHALRRGVEGARVLRERASGDTIENARFTLALLRETLGPDRAPHIVLVTSDYHSERAAELFRCAGATVEAHPVDLAELPARERASRRRRERFVRVAYWFIDQCRRAGGR